MKPSKLPQPAFLLSVLTLLSSAVVGCAAHDPQAGLKATLVDKKRGTNDYWLQQPPVAQATSEDFQRLWRGARRVTLDHGFGIDRVDLRDGVMTTFALTSKQVFEVWRSDVVTAPAIVQSTLGTIRRTLRWDVKPTEAKSFVATPTVLIERYQVEERRLTNAMQYRDIYSIDRPEGDQRKDLGEDAPDEYWYPIGRDRDLERQLVNDLRGKI